MTRGFCSVRNFARSARPRLKSSPTAPAVSQPANWSTNSSASIVSSLALTTTTSTKQPSFLEAPQQSLSRSAGMGTQRHRRRSMIDHMFLSPYDTWSELAASVHETMSLDECKQVRDLEGLRHVAVGLKLL